MMPDVSGKQIAQYTFECLLGAGAFGQVYLARKQNDPDQYAIKMISFESLKDSGGIVGKLLKEEINALANIDNPNVIKCIEYIQTKNYCYIVTEYCNSGDVQQLLNEKGHFDESLALDIMKQILNGLFGLHQKNYMHRDIKLPNILIHNKSIFKMADLGFCIKLQNQDDKDELCLGSKGTMAPEVLREEPYGLSADIFSTGAIFYQLLFGQLPFNCYQDQIFLKEVKEQKINFQHNGIRISSQMQDLIKKMLQYYPEDRITFQQLYQLPIFLQNTSMIRNKQVSRISKVTENFFDLMKTQHFYETKDANQLQIPKKVTQITQDIQQNKSQKIVIKSIMNQSEINQTTNQTQGNSNLSVSPGQQYQQKQQQLIIEQNSQKNINDQQLASTKIRHIVDPSQIFPLKSQIDVIKEKNEVLDKYYARLNSQQYLIRTVQEIDQLEFKQSTIVREQAELCSFIIYKKRKQELEKFCQIIKDKVNLFNTNQIEEVINQLKIEQIEDTLYIEIKDMQNELSTKLDKLFILRKRYSYHKWLSELNLERGPLFDDVYEEIIQATIKELMPFMKEDKYIACCLIHLQGCLDVKTLMNRIVNLEDEFTKLATESLQSIIAKVK